MTPRLLALGLLLAGPAFAREKEVLSPDLSQPQARAEAQLNVLEGLVRSGMVEDALRVASQLRESGMDDPKLDLLQARAMHAAGMSAQAAEMLKTLTRHQPRDEAAWSELGVVLADTQDTAGAIVALERARRLDPEDPRVLNNLGYLEMASGDSKRAVTLLQAALVQEPSNIRTRNNLGFALARLERDSEAHTAFLAAGSEADARYNMGVACEQRGDTASALTNYQAALAASENHGPARAAISRLLHTESP